MPTCRLCDQRKKLCNSHIIPEFLFKPIYDEKHRGTVLKSEPKKKFFIQKGFRERLFCRVCEDKFQKFEDYVAKEWYQNRLIPKRSNKKLLTIKNLDYRLFKLFHLSILFRSSVSTIPEYKHIDLGPHENRIKELIFNDDPGPKNRYTFFCVFLTNKGNKVEGIMHPQTGKLGSQRVHTFFFGGVQWNYIVSSHTPKEYLDILYTGEDLYLIREEFMENKFIKDFAIKYHSST